MTRAHVGAALLLAVVLLGAAACRAHGSAPRPSDAVTLDALLADQGAYVGHRATVRGHLARADQLTSGATHVRVVWVGDGPSPLDALVGREVEVEGAVGISYAVVDPRVTDDGSFREAHDVELQVSSARPE